jgi:hypothetical protein
MIAVPVVNHLANGERSAEPTLTVGPAIRLEPLEELVGRRLCVEPPPMSFAVHPPRDSEPSTVAFDPRWGCCRHVPLPRPEGEDGVTLASDSDTFPKDPPYLRFWGAPILPKLPRRGLAHRLNSQVEYVRAVAQLG